MYNAQCSLQITFQCSGLVVTERQVAEGEQQTEILSVNGKPSEYRSLNILSAMSAFVNIFFLFYYLCDSQINSKMLLVSMSGVLKIWRLLASTYQKQREGCPEHWLVASHGCTLWMIVKELSDRGVV